eukprot:TRINITY_DN2802_c0_g3_i1.p1 TRINITY_DN2802_c0_g3~~TRINITY_DN2802_c0_g3_i1.p1  ORF type:complete len:384 (+),score=104.24 TRINITY_DN2802_c0_g3_i1:107-1258(+)
MLATRFLFLAYLSAGPWEVEATRHNKEKQQILGQADAAPASDVKSNDLYDEYRPGDCVGAQIKGSQQRDTLILEKCGGEGGDKCGECKDNNSMLAFNKGKVKDCKKVFYVMFMNCQNEQFGFIEAEDILGSLEDQSICEGGSGVTSSKEEEASENKDVEAAPSQVKAKAVDDDDDDDEQKPGAEPSEDAEEAENGAEGASASDQNDDDDDEKDAKVQTTDATREGSEAAEEPEKGGEVAVDSDDAKDGAEVPEPAAVSGSGDESKAPGEPVQSAPADDARDSETKAGQADEAVSAPAAQPSTHVCCFCKKDETQEAFSYKRFTSTCPQPEDCKVHKVVELAADERPEAPGDMDTAQRKKYLTHEFKEACKAKAIKDGLKINQK